MSDTPEFPAELIERCAKTVLGHIGYTALRDVAAVLRESGHAELVAALKAMLHFVGYEHMSDYELRCEVAEGNGFAPDILAARAALRKAGAL